MKIKKMDGLGISVGNEWIRYDSPRFPKGNLYTEDEVNKWKYKFEELKNTIEEILKEVGK